MTPGAWLHPERFRLRAVRNHEDLSDLRLTVDTVEDFELVEMIYAALGDDAELEDVLGLLAQRPELLAINAGVAQKGLHA